MAFTPVTDKKVALFLADGFEVIEGLTVADILYRAGIPCVKVAVNGDPDRIVTSSHEIKVIADISIEEADLDSFDMLVLPGGMPGAKNLGECKKLTDALVKFNAENKEIAAICAAPTVLAGLGILDGRQATCFPAQACNMKDAVLTHAAATVDGNIITGRGMGCSVPFALTIMAHYLGEEAAKKMADTIVWPK